MFRIMRVGQHWQFHGKDYVLADTMMAGSPCVLLASPPERAEEEEGGTWMSIRHVQAYGHLLRDVEAMPDIRALTWTDEARDPEVVIRRLAADAMTAELPTAVGERVAHALRNPDWHTVASVEAELAQHGIFDAGRRVSAV